VGPREADHFAPTTTGFFGAPEEEEAPRRDRGPVGGALWKTGAFAEGRIPRGLYNVGAAFWSQVDPNDAWVLFTKVDGAWPATQVEEAALRMARGSEGISFLPGTGVTSKIADTVLLDSSLSSSNASGSSACSERL
jgi:hypothetical protein